jgi:transposase
MPAERTAMRHVREVLRLKFVGGVPIREIARRVGVAPSTVRSTLERYDDGGTAAAVSKAMLPTALAGPSQSPRASPTLKFMTH